MIELKKLASFCKRRGIVFPNSEIYGGFAGFFDYGPVGVEILKNIKNEWWKSMVHGNSNVVGIDGAIITHPKAWEASGHVSKFVDLLISCKKCGEKFRADHVIEDSLKSSADGMKPKEIEEKISSEKIKCPSCKGELSNVSEFNPMFKTQIGPAGGEFSYLRPETAQLIYLNYKNVVDTCRQKIPFGIAQMGKAFRNEISPRNFLFRVREFEQMEMQYFIHQKDADAVFEKWRDSRFKWFIDLGIKKENLRLREHLKTELAHYAIKAVDIEYKFDFGWKEIEGIHNRGDWDLSHHEKFSGKELKYLDEETKEKFTPWIIETSAGADRIFLTFIADAYSEEEVKGETRVVLKLHPKLAAYKAAVFPLVNKNGLPDKAVEVFETVRNCVACFYDDKGSIGRRYRRMDEIGTPLCITIDHQTMEDNTITVRNRDSMEQKRIPMDKLLDEIYKSLYT